MKHQSAALMDSFRLAESAAPVTCRICGEGNYAEAPLCRTCAAPMALARQAPGAATLLAVLGAGGAGKTVYLGMLLDMLSRQPLPMQITARGAFSIRLQQATAGALARCQFPPRTPTEPERWDWVHCRVAREAWGAPLELIVPDIAGEALLQEIDRPRSFRAVDCFLRQSAAALVLIDAAALADGARPDDYFALKLVTHVGQLEDQQQRLWQRRPVAVIFTKADQCEACAEDPEGFAQRQAPGLWRQCRELFGVHRYFAASVAGACASGYARNGDSLRVPLRVEPHGVIEPLLWVLDNLQPPGRPGKFFFRRT